MRKTSCILAILAVVDIADAKKPTRKEKKAAADKAAAEQKDALAKAAAVKQAAAVKLNASNEAQAMKKIQDWNKKETEAFIAHQKLSEECHAELTGWLKKQPKSVQAKWGAAMIDHEPEMMGMWNDWIVNEDIFKIIKDKADSETQTHVKEMLQKGLKWMKKVEKVDVPNPKYTADNGQPQKIKQYRNVSFMRSGAVVNAFKIAQATHPKGLKACDAKMAALKADVTQARTKEFCDKIQVPGVAREKQQPWIKDCYDKQGDALTSLIDAVQKRPNFTSAVYMTSTMAAAATVFALF